MRRKLSRPGDYRTCAASLTSNWRADYIEATVSTRFAVLTPAKYKWWTIYIGNVSAPVATLPKP